MCVRISVYVCVCMNVCVLLWGHTACVCVCVCVCARDPTLHHAVGGLHGRQVGDDGDVVVPAGALDVDVDGALDLAVQARHHARGVGHVGQAALAVVPARGDRQREGWCTPGRVDSTHTQGLSHTYTHSKYSLKSFKCRGCEIRTLLPFCTGL